MSKPRKRTDGPEKQGNPTLVDQKYRDWIKKNVPEYKDAYGQCAKHTKAMAEAFPELRIVKGHYFEFAWGEREHWWCETKDGVIVDSTAEQFPSKGFAIYTEFLGTKEELPTGRCMDCGDDVYDGKSFCSKRCEKAYIAYLNE